MISLATQTESVKLITGNKLKPVQDFLNVVLELLILNRERYYQDDS